MSKKPTKGDQFINKNDLNKITNDFINFYYKNWMENTNILFANPIWKPYTKINVDGVSLNPQQTVQFHKNLEKGSFKLDKYQFVPDGSRRIDIMVKGVMTKKGISKNIVQVFALVEVKKQFYLKSMQIFII